MAISILARLRGVDFPEINTDDGQRARDYVRQLLRPANVGWDDMSIRPREPVVESFKDRRSFARWIDDVWLLDCDGQFVALAEALLVAGMARLSVR